MGKIKGWKKLLTKPSALQNGGDTFHGIWGSSNDSSYLFIVDDNFGEYIIGRKSPSQMDEPEIISRANTLDKAKLKAINYMRRHPNG